MVESEMERVQAVERYRSGERPVEICASLGRSLRWLYKWVERAEAGQQEWWVEASRRPRRMAGRTEDAIEGAVLEVRRLLEEAGQFCGAQSIAWELEELAIEVPSITTINRIIKRTDGRDQDTAVDRPKANDIQHRRPTRRDRSSKATS